jgi:hypothetical protein
MPPITWRSVTPGIFHEVVLAIEDPRRLPGLSCFRIANEGLGFLQAFNLEEKENVVGVLNGAADMEELKASLLMGCCVRSKTAFHRE